MAYQGFIVDTCGNQFAVQLNGGEGSGIPDRFRVFEFEPLF